MVISMLQYVAMGFSKMLAVFTSADTAIRIPIAISLGAVPGALSRYYLTVWIAQWLGTTFPLGTFLINLTGALIMGFFVTFTLDPSLPSPELRWFIATGFLGSYTTFSTYALETSSLLQTGNWGRSLVYWSGSAILGVICLELGSLLAKRLP